MTKLYLDSNDCDVLRQVISSYLGNLSMEISDTDLKEFREQLKAKREVLNKILKQMSDNEEDMGFVSTQYL